MELAKPMEIQCSSSKRLDLHDSRKIVQHEMDQVLSGDEGGIQIDVVGTQIEIASNNT